MTNAMNRRIAISALLGVGAGLAAPGIASASPDAELFVLAHRAKEMQQEADAAHEVFVFLREQYAPPTPPADLLIRPGDNELFHLAAEGNFAERIGEAFDAKEMARVRLAQKLAETMFVAAKPDSEIRARAVVMITRATEVISTEEVYRAEEKRSLESSERHAAWAKWNDLHERACRVLAQLAFTPAHTVEGVLAKLDVVAEYVELPEAETCHDLCEVDDFVAIVVAEFGQLRKSVEA